MNFNSSEVISILSVISSEVTLPRFYSLEKNQIATKGQMIYFDQSSDEINLNCVSDKGSYLVLAGKPLNEPIARYGPFVANTDDEIKKAMLDYQNNKMGSL